MSGVGTRLTAPLLLVAAVLAAGCSLTERPVPTPLLDPPATVLVLPPENGTTDEALPLIFTASVVRTLQARGYAVVPPSLAQQWLAEADLQDKEILSPELMAWAQTRGIEALLGISIERFHTWWFDGLRELDAVVVYRLLDTRSCQVLFERRSEAAYYLPIESGFGFGGPFEDRFGGGHYRASPYREPQDIVRALHRGALAYMPAGAFAESER